MVREEGKVCSWEGSVLRKIGGAAEQILGNMSGSTDVFPEESRCLELMKAPQGHQERNVRYWVCKWTGSGPNPGIGLRWV